MAERHCQLGGRFSGCHNPPITTCQYCGRYFCAQHTYFMEGHDAVCTRDRCRHKHDDLVEHMEYKRRVAERNRVGLCGIDGCGPHPRLQCSLCQGHFCDFHIMDKMYPFREGRVVIDRPASICKRCWDRRKIWRA